MIGDPFSKHWEQMVYCLKSMLLFREWSVELGYFRKTCCCRALTDVRLATLMKCVPTPNTHIPNTPGSVPAIEFAYWAKVSFSCHLLASSTSHWAKAYLLLLCKPLAASERKRARTMQKLLESKCHLRVYSWYSWTFSQLSLRENKKIISFFGHFLGISDPAQDHTFHLGVTSYSSLLI